MSHFSDIELSSEMALTSTLTGWYMSILFYYLLKLYKKYSKRYSGKYMDLYRGFGGTFLGTLTSFSENYHNP